MARLHCLLAAVAAVLLAAAPLHAQQQQQQLAQRATFVATLAPLPNTTGVDLGGSGSARLTFEGCDAASDACAASNIELTVAGLVRTAMRCSKGVACVVAAHAPLLLAVSQNSPIVAVHVHKGLPSENGARRPCTRRLLPLPSLPLHRCHHCSSVPRDAGPIFLAVCGNTPAFTVQVVNSAPGRGTFTCVCALLLSAVVTHS